MRVKRARARRGERVTWYIWADRPEEQAAIRAGVLEDAAPEGSLMRFVLAWGFGSRAGAEAAMERMREELDLPEMEDLTGWPARVITRIVADDARLRSHLRELLPIEAELRDLAKEMHQVRLFEVARRLAKWQEDHEQARLRLVDSVQLACLMCGVEELAGESE